MSVFESTLPPFPDEVGNEAIVVYDASTNTYTLENQFYHRVYQDSDGRYKFYRYSNNGITQRWNYYNDDRGWVRVGGMHALTDPIYISGDHYIIYCNVDMYLGNTDTIYYEHDDERFLDFDSDTIAVNGNISAPIIYRSLLSEIVLVLAVIFTPVIAFIALRKAIVFFKNILER